jgi:hypothetical protein
MGNREVLDDASILAFGSRERAGRNRRGMQ